MDLNALLVVLRTLNDKFRGLGIENKELGVAIVTVEGMARKAGHLKDLDGEIEARESRCKDLRKAQDECERSYDESKERWRQAAVGHEEAVKVWMKKVDGLRELARDLEAASKERTAALEVAYNLRVRELDAKIEQESKRLESIEKRLAIIHEATAPAK